MRRLFKISLCFAVIVTLTSACSNKKNTWFTRNFHNMSAYYNIYWNGFETYKELLAKIASLGHDNFNHVLNVFEHGTALDTVVTIEMTNRMIEKATKAAQKHRINIRGVEYVKTMEKVYMLMGKGYFYQHNYSMARTVFNFVSSQFPNTPIRYESLLWSARTYIQEKEFEMASALILRVRNEESNLYKQTYRDLPAVTADLYIAQARYSEAIPYLQEAMARSRNRDFRNRLEFILGQIFQLEGRRQEAYAAYRNVIRRNPSLELEYNARLNMALSYDGSYGNRETLARELKKMLQDVKNERFFGRIYFVLGEMALADGDRLAGIEYLRKSVEYSGSSHDQLVISATRLADLHFDDHDYATAQRYYKNAVSVMTSDHRDFDRVRTRAENLTELVKFLEIVRYEEQMQRLASLPENRRNEEIDRLIEEYKERMKETADATPRALTQTGTQSQQSTWYFYNEQAKTFGASEFLRRWGRRENEDFWFLQNKPAFAMHRVSEVERTEREEQEEQRTVGDYTPADREYYLVNMPIRAAARELSNRRLEENLFLLGIGYFDLVEEPKLGIETLEKLLTRFPTTGYKLQAYYYLYRMNMVLGNEIGRQKYRNLLLLEFPDSDLTRQITDPNFFRLARENTARAELLYQYTFEAYQGGFFEVVLENVRDAERRYPGNALMPRFKYLEIMASAGQVGIAATIESLEQYIRTFPQEREMAELVRNTIEILKQSELGKNLASTGETRQQTTQQTVETQATRESEHDISMFTFNPAAPHYCLIFVNVPEVNTDVMKIRLSDFNRRSYAQDNLQISGTNWEDGYYLIYLHTFRTASIATGYFNELRGSRFVFGAIPREFYQIMLISADNFVKLMELRNREAYQYFFEQHYNP